jgi:DNA-directed RNA polymerase specialized sigma24 family protein
VEPWLRAGCGRVIFGTVPDSRFLVGSRIRFEALYGAHCGAVRAFVHRRVAPEVADDVVSEVFVIAWRRLDQAPPDALPWLLGIARGVLANQRRGEARRLALHDRLAASAVARVEHGPGSSGGESEVIRALGSLSERDQELLLLVAWDGLDRAQAAGVLGQHERVFGASASSAPVI